MSKWILVNSHRRSGTHFLIDSICSNVAEASFPVHRNLPRDFNIGSLFRKKERIYKIFLDALNSNRVVIIKSHLLPEEIRIGNLDNKHEELIAEIFEKSYKLCIYREGKEVLLSLYRFLNYKNSFKDFLHSPNEDISPSRLPDWEDENRARFWAYHVASWARESNVKCVAFDELTRNFDHTMETILDFVDEPLPDVLIKPQLPRNKLLHKLSLRLRKLGLVKSVRSTAVKPGGGKPGEAREIFDREDRAFFAREALAAGLSDVEAMTG